MATTTATQKGQVLIPAILRKKLNIRKGTRLSVTEQDGRIIMEPLPDDFIRQDRGRFKTKGKMLKRLLAERESEARR